MHVLIGQSCHLAVHLSVQWLQEGNSAALDRFSTHPLHPLHEILVPRWAIRVLFCNRPLCLMTESIRLLVSGFADAESFSSFEQVFQSRMLQANSFTHSLIEQERGLHIDYHDVIFIRYLDTSTVECRSDTTAISTPTIISTC
jgi:hypothetical protein